MEEEIDLRPYVSALLDKWYWLVAILLLAAVLAYFLSSFIPPTYEATALVAITDSRQKVQFDPRIVTQADDQPLKAYPEIAESDELLSDLLLELPPGDLTVGKLRGDLTAEAGGDPSLLRLTAANGNPSDAAILANTWAELFVNRVNKIYGDQGDEQLLFFEEQLQKAALELEAAERALIDFQARNLSMILENELLSLQQTQADLLAKQRQIDLLLQDIDSLLDQGGSSKTSIPADYLTTALLQIRAFGGPPANAETISPWQLQLTIDDFSNAEQNDRLAFIGNLREALLTQAELIESQFLLLEPQILTVQESLQRATTEQSSLQRDFDVAEETYTTLARTVEGKRITSQNPGNVRLASEAAEPLGPVSPRKTVSAIIAGTIALILAILFIVIKKWWTIENGQENGTSPPDVTNAVEA